MRIYRVFQLHLQRLIPHKRYKSELPLSPRTLFIKKYLLVSIKAALVFVGDLGLNRQGSPDVLVTFTPRLLPVVTIGDLV